MKDLTEIIEIVFERVQLKKTVMLLIETMSKSTLENCNNPTSLSEIDIHFKEKIFITIDQSSGGSFYFNFLNFDLKGVLFSRAGFQIYKYENIYDLNLHIERIEVIQNISISELQKRVKSLAEDLEANKYYCGYEPAVDEDTRLFSGNILDL